MDGIYRIAVLKGKKYNFVMQFNHLRCVELSSWVEDCVLVVSSIGFESHYGTFFILFPPFFLQHGKKSMKY